MLTPIQHSFLNTPRGIYQAADPTLRSELEQPIPMVNEFVVQLFQHLNVQKISELNHIIIRLSSVFPSENETSRTIRRLCHEIFYFRNRMESERILLKIYHLRYENLPAMAAYELMNFSVKQLCLLDVALTYRFRRIADSIWAESPSLDIRTPDHQDLIAIVLAKGDFVDVERLLLKIREQKAQNPGVQAYLLTKKTEIALSLLGKELSVLKSILGLFAKHMISISFLIEEMLKYCSEDYRRCLLQIMT